MTIHPDNGGDPIVQTLTVPANTVRSFDRATLRDVNLPALTPKPKPLPTGAIVVEPLSPDVVVSAGLETDTALAVVPCATTASPDWQFAAGTTVRGVHQWLVIDNPFSADARVDVNFRTDSGLLLLPQLQGLDIPGRSRVIEEVDNQAVRQERVAVEVHAVIGQVVAAQTLDFGSDSGVVGVATTFGTLAPASRWWFPDNQTVTDAKQWVAIANTGQVDADVDVFATTGSGIVQPVIATVASGTSTWVQVGGCPRNAKNCLAVPDGIAFELSVQTSGTTPVVAQTLSRFNQPKTAVGATTSMGTTASAREWVIPRTRARAEESTSISIVNTGVPPAHVSVRVVYRGTSDTAAALAVTVPSNARVDLPTGPGGVSRPGDAAVIIRSDEPIYAESTIFAKHDATRAPGVPTR